MVSLFLSLFSSAVFAIEQKPALVVFVNFDCPHCQKFIQFSDTMRNAIQSDSVDFRILPISGSPDEKRAIFYYAVDAYDKKMGDKVMKAFFKFAKENIDMVDYKSIIDWLSIEYGDENWKRFSSKKFILLGKYRLAKANELASKSGLLVTPTFVSLLPGESPNLIITNDRDAMASRVLSVIKEFKDELKK